MVQITRLQIVSEAEKFVGTPYRHQGALPGSGADCIGLIRGMWKALYGWEPPEAVDYTPDIGEGNHVETMLEMADKYLLVKLKEERLPGDVLMFRLKSHMVVKHTGILVGSPVGEQFIHAQSGDMVRKTFLSTPWLKLLHAVYSFPHIIGEG